MGKEFGVVLSFLTILSQLLSLALKFVVLLLQGLEVAEEFMVPPLPNSLAILAQPLVDQLLILFGDSNQLLEHFLQLI